MTLQAQLDAANRRITELEAELEQAHYAAAFGPDEALDRLFKDGLDVYEGNPDDLGDVPTRKVFKVFDAGDRDVGIDPVTYFYVDVPPEDQNARLRTEVVMAAKDLVYVLNGRVSEEEWRGYVDGTLSLSGLAESVLSEVVRLRHEIARYEAEGRERDALAKGKYTLECRNGVVHGNRSRDICLHCRLAELERENAELRRDAKARTGDNAYVDAVLKERNELRRAVEEGSKEMKAVWDYLQRVSPWSESSDMDWADEIICGIGGLERRIAELEGNPPTLSLTPDGCIVDPRAAVTQREAALEKELQEAKDCQKTGDDACGACLRCLTIRCDDLVEKRARALEQVKGYQTECREVEQILGAALGYPWFKDDPANFPGATEKDGVCVGEHVPSTIAAEAAKTIEKLKADLTRAEGRIGEDWRDRLLDS